MFYTDCIARLELRRRRIDRAAEATMEVRGFEDGALRWLVPALMALAAACGSGGSNGAGVDAGKTSVGSSGSGSSSGSGGGSNGSSGSGSGASGSSGTGGSSGSSGASGSGGSDDAGAQEGSTLDASGSGGGSDGGASCTMKFPAVTDFGAKGPYSVTIDCSAPTSSTTDGMGCAVWHPTPMGQNGLKHPLIVWGNGTSAPAECTGGSHTFGEYDWLFNQWASHGFIVVAANTNSTGAGTALLDCLHWMEQQNSASGSPYNGVVDVGNYGASGHSQGGASAINVGEDPRIHATVPFLPYTVNGGFSYDSTAPMKQHGPMFLGSGSMDTIATPSTNQAPVFSAITSACFWGTLTGENHVGFAGGTPPNATESHWLAPSTAWFRLFLMCDQSARPMFYGPSCTLCTDTTNWAVQTKNM